MPPSAPPAARGLSVVAPRFLGDQHAVMPSGRLDAYSVGMVLVPFATSWAILLPLPVFESYRTRSRFMQPQFHHLPKKRASMSRLEELRSKRESAALPSSAHWSTVLRMAVILLDLNEDIFRTLADKAYLDRTFGSRI